MVRLTANALIKDWNARNSEDKNRQIPPLPKQDDTNKTQFFEAWKSLSKLFSPANIAGESPEGRGEKLL
jgi:hypothetical protein